jgi:hypothetical protein
MGERRSVAVDGLDAPDELDELKEPEEYFYKAVTKSIMFPPTPFHFVTLVLLCALLCSLW